MLSDCTDCDGGKYCLVSGNDTVTDDCDAGFYCIGKADRPDPRGKYCNPNH